jgi:hypothetical protein
MAGENEFKVIFGADGKPLEKTLTELEADLKRFNKQLNTTSDAKAISELNKRLKETHTNIKILKNFDGINNGLSTLRTGSAQAGAAMVSLNRVIQDAPFGFIAIQNNLTELPATFSALVASTGSTTAALKALGSSILGVGGIGFALSAVSSLITVSVQKYGSLSNAVKALLGDLNDQEEAQRKFRQELEESNKQAGEELTRLNLLVSASADITRSTSDRKKAVKALKDEFPDYFSQLTEEEILNGRVAVATNKARNAILSKARAAAASKRLSDVETNLLNIELKKIDAAEKYTKAQEKLTKAQNDRLDPQVRERDRALGGLSEVVLAQDEVFKATQNLQQLSKEESKFLNERNFLIAQFEKNDYSVEAITGPETVARTKKQTDALREQIQTLENLRTSAGLLKSEEFKLGELKIQLLFRDGKKEGLDDNQIERIYQSLIKSQSEATKSSFVLPIAVNPEIKVSPGTSFQGSLVSFNQSMINLLTTNGEKAGQAYQEGLRMAFGESLSKTLQDAVVPAFATLGTAIGDILGGDSGLGGAAEAFLAVIGSVLQQVGIQIVAASKAVIALKTALSGIFGEPGASLVAGIGLIAVGQLLKGIKLDSKKFADGGIVMGPTLGMVGEAGPEMIIPLSRANQVMDNSGSGGGQVIFEIEGRKLVGVLQRTNESLARKR